MKYSPLVSVLLGGALPSLAAYELDVDLGVLPPGDTAVMGTTAATVNPSPPPAIIGGHNNSIFPKNLVANGDLLNWGNEIVFRFELAQPTVISITANAISGTGLDPDPDFFLLDGLATSLDVNSGKISADNAIDVAFLDGTPPQTAKFTPLAAGTYYLAVEHFDGQDGAVTPEDATFEITLTVGVTARDFALDIGTISAEGAPLTINTSGSAFDTELAIYDDFGSLLFQDDDSGSGTASEISLPNGLAPGDYYAVIAGHDTTFDSGFEISSGGAVGDWSISFSRGPDIPPGELTGTTEGGFPATESQFLIFTVAPRPLDAEDLGVLAEGGEAFSVDSFGSGFDTELTLYNSAGYWLLTSDDSGDDLQSQIDIPDGLPPGNYFFVLVGFDHSFEDAFSAEVVASSAGGSYVFNHPLGSSSGVLNSNTQKWFGFEISVPPVPPSIDLTAIDFDPASNQFTVSWTSTAVSGPFTIWVGNASDLAALQAAPNNVLPTPAVTGATSPETFTVPVALQGAPVFLQITD